MKETLIKSVIFHYRYNYLLIRVYFTRLKHMKKKGGAKMAKKQIANAINNMEKFRRKIDEQVIALQSDCSHRKDDMKVTLTRIKNTKDGDENNGKIYACIQCNKKVNITQFDESQINYALEIVDSMLDVIKMRTSTDRSKSKKVFAIAAHTQFLVRTFIKSSYDNCCKNNQKSHKNNQRNQYGSSTIWEKPIYK